MTPQDLTPTAREGVSDPPAPNAISSGGGPPPPSAKRHLLGGEGGAGFRCPTPPPSNLLSHLTAARAARGREQRCSFSLRGRARRLYGLTWPQPHKSQVSQVAEKPRYRRSAHRSQQSAHTARAETARAPFPKSRADTTQPLEALRRVTRTSVIGDSCDQEAT